MKARLASLLFLLPIYTAAHGAAINWTAANIVGDTDVATNGALVGAFNVGTSGIGASTVNGVTFQSFALSGTSSTVGNFSFTSSGSFTGSNSGAGSTEPPFSGLSSGYQTLLQSFGATPSGFSFTLTMSGLSPGTPYLLQWWANDSSSAANWTVNAEATNTIGLQTNPFGFVFGAGGVGQFANGSFVADSASQAVVFFSNDGIAMLNGFQLRDATLAPVPEPSTYALMLAGLGLLGLVGLRRRTR